MAFDPDAYLAQQGVAAAPVAAQQPKKPAFNPDLYLATKDAMAGMSGGAPTPIEVQQFDPEQYLNQKASQLIDADQAQYGSTEQQLKTAAEGLASGATLGLSKVAENKILGIDPKDIAGRERANPWVSGLAGAVGTGGLLAATGGAGGLAEGMGAGARIASLGAEGAIIGGVNQATDDWSQNKPLDAQKILASAGIGTALGLGGGAVVEGAQGLLGKTTKMINFFDKFMDDSGGGPSGSGPSPGFLNNIKEAYHAAGENPNSLISDLTDNLTDLYNTGKEASKKIYTEAGNFHLNAALEDTTVEQAKLAALDTAGKVKSLLTRVGEQPPIRLDEFGNTLPSAPAATESVLSGTSDRIVTERLQKLEEQLNSAKTPRDVHDYLSSFATDLDKGKLIKFDKMPTAGQMADQEVLMNVRNTVRGDLKNPQLWGDAAHVYEDLSTKFANYQVARRNFEKDFMKNRVSSNGTTQKVVDPVKVKSYFADPTAPGQQLKNKSLLDFTYHGLKNADYAEDFEGFKKGMDDLGEHLEKNIQGQLKLDAKSKLHAAIKNAKSGHMAGFGTLALVETLPAPLKAVVLGLSRYAGKGSAHMVGGDLFKGIQLAKSLATHADAATAKIAQGAKAIFRASPKKD